MAGVFSEKFRLHMLVQMRALMGCFAAQANGLAEKCAQPTQGMYVSARRLEHRIGCKVPTDRAILTISSHALCERAPQAPSRERRQGAMGESGRQKF